MPELPEVETIKIGLARLLPDLVVKDVQHNWAKSFPNAPADVARFLVGAKVTGVRRRAKVLIIDLDSQYSLVIHLKMTGQLVFRNQEALATQLDGAQGAAEQRSKSYERYGERAAEAATKRSASSASRVTGSARKQAGALRKPVSFGAGHPTQDLVGVLPSKATHVTIDFIDGSRLFFNDQRKFGWMRLLPTVEIPEIDFFKKVGPEPLDADFTASQFMQRLMRRKNSNIKSVLLDQTVLAGVGNIYADESLWSAKIHPATIVSQIPKTKLVTLYNGLIEVLKLSIAKGGSTDKNYVDAEGKAGSYLTFANVFRRNGQPCPRCGHIIEKTRLAGRGTHFCPHCQKLPKAKV